MGVVLDVATDRFNGQVNFYADVLDRMSVFRMMVVVAEILTPMAYRIVLSLRVLDMTFIYLGGRYCLKNRYFY